MLVILYPSKSILCLSMLWEVDFYEPHHLGSFTLLFLFDFSYFGGIAKWSEEEHKEIRIFISPFLILLPACLYFDSNFIPLPKVMALIRQPCTLATVLGNFRNGFFHSFLQPRKASSNCESLGTLYSIDSLNAYIQVSSSESFQFTLWVCHLSTARSLSNTHI